MHPPRSELIFDCRRAARSGAQEAEGAGLRGRGVERKGGLVGLSRTFDLHSLRNMAHWRAGLVDTQQEHMVEGQLD